MSAQRFLKVPQKSGGRAASQVPQGINARDLIVMKDIIINRRMDLRQWLALVVLSILWGGSFLFAGIQVKWLPPFTIAFLRVGLAAFILGGLIRALGKGMPREASAWRAFAVIGLLNNAIPFSLIAWGQ